MNKDALLATFIGFCVGLFITSAILVGPRIARSFSSFLQPIPTIISRIIHKQKISPVSEKQKKTENLVTFKIQAPLTESIAESNEILVSGTAESESMILAAGSVSENTFKVSADGTFAVKVSLIEGKNDIVISQILDNKLQSQNLSIYYTPETF